MSKRVLKFIILLTAIVGFVVPSYAQVEPSDSLRPDGGVFGPDTILVPSVADSITADTTADRFHLSTDSIYGTPISGQTDGGGFLESMVEYTASDSIVGSLAIGEAYLYNQAEVKYENMTIKAGYIQINFDNSEVYATGLRDTSGAIVQKPVFTEGGKSYRADTMRYNFDTKKAKIKRVITKEGEGYLHGEDVKKINDQVFYIKNAAYTTCSHEHPHFQIKSPKAKVVAGDKIITKFAFIEVLDVPTPLMVPFGFFPTTETRKSGIIIPQYGKNENRGYFLTNGGYYWAINDYLDLTVTGDIYSQGGYGYGARSNYRKRYKYSGNLGFNYSKIKYGREEFYQYGSQFFADNSQFAVNWSHSQDPKANPSMRFSANVNLQSSNYFRLNSTDRDEVLTNTVNSSVSVNKSWVGKPYNLTASLNHTQNNSTNDMTVTLPDVNFSVNRQFPFKRKAAVGKKKWFEEIGYSYNVTGKNEIRTKMGKPFFTETVFTDSARNGIQHRIPISANYKVFNNFVLNPQINYTERWYFQRSVWGYNDSLQRAMVMDTAKGFYGVRDFSTSANLSTKLYGQWNYKGFVKAIRHVATPTVGLSYRPDFATDFWGYYQNVQVDSLGTMEKRNMYNYGLYGSPGEGVQGNVNFSLLNTLESKIRDKRDSTGSKKVKILERLSLSTSYNIAADEFKWAPVSLTMSSSVLQGLVSLNYSSTFDLYGYDEEAGQRVNEFAYKVNGKLLRTTNQRFTTGLNLDASRFDFLKKDGGNGGKSKSSRSSAEEPVSPMANDLGITAGDIDYYRQRRYVDFSIPWSINANYNLTKSYSGLESTVRQSADVSGNFEITENWRAGFSTGYDIEAKDFTYTSFDFYRDLHCWEIRCSWVPFGLQQSYTLTIRVKAETLKDLKLERIRGIGDFER